VDAGYLFAAGGELCCGTKARNRIQLDASEANRLLTDLATTRCQLPVLRTYWYDGARDGIPTASQQIVASLPNVKLRLGRLNAKNQQKGVDALIYRDLMTLAQQRAICEAFLLSGDEDLREGVRAAQDQGVRVTLIGIDPVSQDYNQSRDLVHEADEVVHLDKSQLATLLSPVKSAALPVLSEIGSPPAPDLGELGRAFARQWLGRATDTELASLKAQFPRIPKTLDVELLRSAEQALLTSLRGSDEQHRLLRRSFWSEVSDPGDAGP
jgi:uncharacterized LabA/DUF88 family protein